MKYDSWEIARAIETLEHSGYVVRRPGEATLPVTLEIVQPEMAGFGQVGVRADVTINDVPYAFAERFPVERVFDTDDAEFRHRVVPQIMGRALGRYIGDKLTEGLILQVKEKIDPLVPEKRMSLAEIEKFLSWALRTDRRVEKKGA